MFLSRNALDVKVDAAHKLLVAMTLAYRSQPPA